MILLNSSLANTNTALSGVDNKVNAIKTNDKAWTGLPYVDSPKIGGNVAMYMIKNGFCFVTGEINVIDTIEHGNGFLNGLPRPAADLHLTLPSEFGNYNAILSANGKLTAYYPATVQVPTRIDLSLCYPIYE